MGFSISPIGRISGANAYSGVGTNINFSLNSSLFKPAPISAYTGNLNQGLAKPKVNYENSDLSAQFEEEFGVDLTSTKIIFNDEFIKELILFGFDGMLGDYLESFYTDAYEFCDFFSVIFLASNIFENNASGDSLKSISDFSYIVGKSATKQVVDTLYQNHLAQTFIPALASDQISDKVVSGFFTSIWSSSWGSFFSEFGGKFLAVPFAQIGMQIMREVLDDLVHGREIKIEDWGDVVYKGAVKTVFYIAGDIVKGIPVIGLPLSVGIKALGAAIAESTANFYHGDSWKITAGVAILAGGAFGLLVLAPLLFSNPAGWALLGVAAIVIGCAALAAAIVWEIQEIYELITFIMDHKEEIRAWFVSKVEDVMHVVNTTLDWGVKLVSNVVTAFKEIGSIVISSLSEIITTTLSFVGDIFDIFSDTLSDVKSIFSNFFQDVVPIFGLDFSHL